MFCSSYLYSILVSYTACCVLALFRYVERLIHATMLPTNVNEYSSMQFDAIDAMQMTK
jgi:hypothetical protein